MVSSRHAELLRRIISGFVGTFIGLVFLIGLIALTGFNADTGCLLL